MNRSRHISSFAALVNLIFLTGCSGGGKVVNVSEFSPPASVTIIPLDKAVKVTWKAGPEETARWFDGYNVYCSPVSLLLRSAEELPEPVKVGRKIHQVVISDLEPGKPYFIHVRSRKKSGELSGPSLPEKIGIPGP